MAEEIQHTRTEGIPPTPNQSQPPMTQSLPSLTPVGISSAYSDASSMHLPPLTAQPSSNSSDSARIAALEGMVNQLAANMTELIALLRDQNRASLSSTLSPGHRLTVDPNSTVPPTFVLESKGTPFSVVTYVLAIYPVTDPLPPPPALTAAPLPSVMFLNTDSTMHAPPPLAMPVPPPVYTVPPPTVPPMINAPAPTHTVEHFPFQAP
ncbi:hypothetical protein CRG98_009933 [Punica granatum]|uniref:Extensin-like n=1 Tax=Punica granatum TaxID=22663 RepID=A0A2I0KME2_PUNGR|nr:hypothetical protein CRG98_009933 [Punica granatum]